VGQIRKFAKIITKHRSVRFLTHGVILQSMLVCKFQFIMLCKTGNNDYILFFLFCRLMFV